MVWNSPLVLERLSKRTLRLTAAAVSLSLVGCSRDMPLEPDTRPVDLGIAFSAVGNLTDLGTLGGDWATATGINRDGDIVGVISGGGLSSGFFLQSGSVTRFSEFGPNDVNRADQIAGSGPSVWQNGTFTELPLLPADPSSCSVSGFASAINATGQVVGISRSGFCDDKPVLWENGSVRDLGSIHGSGFGRAADINDNGQVVGYDSPEAFLWQNGTMQGLGTLGGEYSEAFGINSSGQVVGASAPMNGRPHAFLWTNGSMVDLGTLGGNTSEALDIDDQGRVVGYSTTTNDRTRAFWWQNGVMSDLGTLGGEETRARAMNNAGQVVGQSNTTTGGPAHAVRWTIPSSNFWSVRASLRPERRGHAVAVANGLLYSIGGENTFGNVVSTVQAYNPVTDRWSSKTPLPVGRQSSNGAVTINSIIYVAGGKNPSGALTNTLYAYNTTTNNWSTKTNMPVAGGCGGSGVIGGKLYVFSGCTRSSTGVQSLARLLHRYDPGTNSWATLRPAPTVHSEPVVAAAGGKLYVAGGNAGGGTATNRLDVYDPATDSWSTKTVLHTARISAAGAVVGGKLYVMGGRAGTTYLDLVEVYDPVANSWSTRAPMITNRAGLAAGVVGQFIYAVGGRNSRKAFAVNERLIP